MGVAADREALPADIAAFAVDTVAFGADMAGVT